MFAHRDLDRATHIVSRGRARSRLGPLTLIAGFSVGSLLFQASSAHATMPGPSTIPGVACPHSRWSTSTNYGGGNLSNGGGITVTLYYDTWTCPFQSVGSWSNLSTTWGGPNVQGGFLDYTFAAGTSNDTVTVHACEQSFSGVSLVCNSTAMPTPVGSSDQPFPGFATLPGTSQSLWDYYYVSITAYPTLISYPFTYGNNAPTLLGVGLQ
jgi:hypothetical protein